MGQQAKRSLEGSVHPLLFRPNLDGSLNPWSYEHTIPPFFAKLVPRQVGAMKRNLATPNWTERARPVL